LFESNSSIIKNNKNYSFDCPEIIENKKCNYKVDYWNIGLISFYLLYGFFPIDKDNYYTFNLEKIMQKFFMFLCLYQKANLGSEKLSCFDKIFISITIHRCQYTLFCLRTFLLEETSSKTIALKNANHRN
jgi:serine/threonine protein kinase